MIPLLISAWILCAAIAAKLILWDGERKIGFKCPSEHLPAILIVCFIGGPAALIAAFIQIAFYHP